MEGGPPGKAQVGVLGVVGVPLPRCFYSQCLWVKSLRIRSWRYNCGNKAPPWDPRELPPMPMPIYPSAVEGSDSLSLAYTLIPLIPITLTPDPNSNPYAYPTPPFLTLFFSFPFASYPISPPTLSLSPPPPQSLKPGFGSCRSGESHVTGEAITGGGGPEGAGHGQVSEPRDGVMGWDDGMLCGGMG